MIAAVALLFAGRVQTTVGHGAMVLPLSRNAVEVSLPWDERTAAPDLFPPPSGKEQPCVCANETAGTRTSEDTSGCDNAQACFWFSQVGSSGKTWNFSIIMAIFASIALLFGLCDAHCLSGDPHSSVTAEQLLFNESRDAASGATGVTR